MISIVLSNLGVLRISGKDAKKFLQGQLTCHLDEVTATQSRLGAHCNPQGRVMSLFRLVMFADSYFLLMPQDLIPVALQALKKYAVFFKVDMADVSLEFYLSGHEAAETTDLHLAVNGQLVTEEGVIIRLPGKTPRYLAMRTKEAAPLSLPSVSTQEWHRLEIVNRMPTIYAMTSEKFLPHELNLPELGAVSFDKGCYTGQEIIARMQYRGKLKNHLYCVQATTDLVLQPGDDIYAEQQCLGHLIDFTLIGDHRYQLLIIAPDTKAQKQSLFLDREEKYPLEFD